MIAAREGEIRIVEGHPVVQVPVAEVATVVSEVSLVVALYLEAAGVAVVVLYLENRAGMCPI